MKALRYSLLLPLIHVAMSVPTVYHEEALIWRQIPRVQLLEDFERSAPPPIMHAGPMIAWDPCYEYRASDADRFIFLAEFPSGILFPPHGTSGCNPTVLRPILQKFKSRMRLKTWIVFLDCLLIIGITGQWWLVGRWLDRLRERRKHTVRWIIPVATITIFGGVVAAAALGKWRSLEPGVIILSLIALLAWVGLLSMFAVAAVQWALRLGKVHPQSD